MERKGKAWKGRGRHEKEGGKQRKGKKGKVMGNAGRREGGKVSEWVRKREGRGTGRGKKMGRQA
jgi:hypothetical protein